MGLDSTHRPDRPAVTAQAPAEASAERGSNFFLGFLLLPKDKREALSAVYAYCRLIDDIVDSGSLKKDEARKMLDFWNAEIERLYAGTPTHSISLRLAACLKLFPLPKEGFLEMIRGCTMDLDIARYENFEKLEPYLQGVAGSVGRLTIEIFGYSHTTPERMQEFAKLFGYAFQLTNILRDVGPDLELGRVYLPEDEMKAAGYSPEMLKSRQHNEAFDRLMESQYQRAKTFYRRARNIVDFRDRPGLLAAEIMAHVYEGLLDQIRAEGFRVLFKRSELSAFSKIKFSFKAWLYCQGLSVYGF
jgi:phytoene synthase